MSEDQSGTRRIPNFRLHINRPERILEAAFEVFTRDGFKKGRLEDVARHMGVSKSAILYYFPSKQDLFEKVVRHFCLADLERMREPTDASLADAISTGKGGQVLDMVLREAAGIAGLAAFYRDCLVEEVAGWPVAARCAVEDVLSAVTFSKIFQAANSDIEPALKVG